MTPAATCNKCGGPLTQESEFGRGLCSTCQGPDGTCYCGEKATVVWHVTQEGVLLDSEARCWDHRHLSRGELIQ